MPINRNQSLDRDELEMRRQSARSRRELHGLRRREIRRARRLLLVAILILCSLWSASPGLAQFDLSGYEVESAREMSETLGEFSGIAWDSDNEQILVATVIKGGPFNLVKRAFFVILNDEGILQGQAVRLQNDKKDARDSEGIASVGGGRFVFIEEKRELLTFARLSNERLVPLETVSIGDLGVVARKKNRGPEGVAVKSNAAGLDIRILVESDPKRMFLLKKTGGKWVADRECESFDMGRDWAGMASIPGSEDWLILSEKSKMVYQIDGNCAYVNELNLATIKSKSSIVQPAIVQPEGIAIDNDLNIYIVSEPGKDSKRSHFFKLTAN